MDLLCAGNAVEFDTLRHRRIHIRSKTDCPFHRACNLEAIKGRDCQMVAAVDLDNGEDCLFRTCELHDIQPITAATLRASSKRRRA